MNCPSVHKGQICDIIQVIQGTSKGFLLTYCPIKCLLNVDLISEYENLDQLFINNDNLISSKVKYPSKRGKIIKNKYSVNKYFSFQLLKNIDVIGLFAFI